MIVLDTHIWVWWTSDPARLSPTQRVAAASTQLPGSFHRDPTDQIIVATARVHGSLLVTSDRKILEYAYVETVG